MTEIVAYTEFGKLFRDLSLATFRADQADGQSQAGIVFGQDAADVEKDFVVLNSNKDADAAGAESDSQVIGGKLLVLQRDDDRRQFDGRQRTTANLRDIVTDRES